MLLPKISVLSSCRPGEAPLAWRKRWFIFLKIWLYIANSKTYCHISTIQCIKFKEGQGPFITLFFPLCCVAKILVWYIKKNNWISFKINDICANFFSFSSHFKDVQDCKKRSFFLFQYVYPYIWTENMWSFFEFCYCLIPILYICISPKYFLSFFLLLILLSVGYHFFPYAHFLITTVHCKSSTRCCKILSSIHWLYTVNGSIFFLNKEPLCACALRRRKPYVRQAETVTSFLLPDCHHGEFAMRA